MPTDQHAAFAHRQSVLHRYLEQLAAWGWVSSLLCFFLIAIIDSELPAWVTAAMMTCLSLGPIVSLARRAYAGALACIVILAIVLMQFCFSLHLPDQIAGMLIHILFGVLWWAVGRMFARTFPASFLFVLASWMYRLLALASWIAGSTIMLQIIMQLQTFSQFIHIMSMINPLAASSMTLLVLFPIPVRVPDE